MQNDKPQWMIDHEADDQRNFDRQEATSQEILDMLRDLDRKMEPVIHAYETATTLGRWTKTLGAAILMCFAIWAAFKNF